MLKVDLGGSKGRFCDRMSRRRAIGLGTTGLFGGLTLPQLMRLQAEAPTTRPAKAESLILLFLEGGPSHIDMWDLKPEAPREIRGPYKPIPTNVPGIQVCEHLPRCAKVMDKFTLMRNHSHNDNGHVTGYHYVLTGYRPNFSDGDVATPANELYPAIGSIVSKELGPRSSVPANINMPDPMKAGGPGFYGAEHAPFVIETDPVEPDFQVKDVSPLSSVPSKRFDLRRRLLNAVDGVERKLEKGGHAGVMSKYYDRAFNLITSPEAKKAFDINSESEQVREAYGHTSLGQCALLARRMVEAGCRFVGIDHGSWDTHFSCFPSQTHDLIPHADMAFSALVTDLEQRGLLDSTLVVMMGEMGRTPRINQHAGRDHWSMAQTVVVAGGGIPPGRVIGATDKQAAYPTSDPVGVEDLLFTIFHQLGIDGNKIHYTPLGRPVPIVNGGHLVRDLVG